MEKRGGDINSSKSCFQATKQNLFEPVLQVFVLHACGGGADSFHKADALYKGNNMMFYRFLFEVRLPKT